MEKFNIEYQYQLFLKLVKLSEDNMHPMQSKQIKETFYGASGMILQLLKNDVSEFDEEEAVKILCDLEDQVTAFFDKYK